MSRADQLLGLFRRFPFSAACVVVTLLSALAAWYLSGENENLEIVRRDRAKEGEATLSLLVGGSTQRQELDFVRDYLALESLRLGQRLSVEWALDPDTLQDEIPPLTLQPLVENAIKHGLEPKVEGGRVDVRIAREPGVANGANGANAI